MTRSSIGLAVVLPLFALACEGAPSGGTAPTGSAAPPKPTTAAATAKPTATAATTTAATTTGSAAASAAAGGTSAAASFPATALPSKNFAEFTIGLPPGGKLEKQGEDKSSLDTADYKLMLKAAPKDADATKMKADIQKMPGFKAIAVDSADGFVVEADDKGKPQFHVTRYVKVGDVTVACESALTKPPKDKAKAQEAFDVCGTIKKK